jgi:hypothetical protein
METAMLNEILQIRSALKLLKKCYLDLEITKYMIKDIGTSSIYDKKDTKPDEQDHDTDTHNDEVFGMLSLSNMDDDDFLTNKQILIQ